VNPGAPAIALLQARIDTAKGKPQAANDTLEAAFKASPSPALRAEVIRSRIAAGAIDSAAKELEVLEREGAPKPVVDELRATLLLRQGRAQEASALLAPLAAAAPNDPRAQLRLGVAQLASGNAAAAIPALRKSWEKDPAALPVAALLVQALIGRNQLDEALNVARKTQQSAPKKGQPFALEAAVHLKRPDLESARSALLRGNEIEPSGDLALQLYAVDSALKRSSPEAVLETAWQRTPKDLRLPLALSEAQLRAGNRGAAIATLEKASSAGGPLKAAVLNNLAWWYFEAGDNRARATAESAFRLAPKNASITDTLGWIQVQNGQLPNGLKTLREAAELDSTSADVVEHLAEAELRSGNEAQARQRVQAFVVKHPTAANRPGMAKFLKREAS
jgi:Flp pilus assembly protein TadD